MSRNPYDGGGFSADDEASPPSTLVPEGRYELLISEVEPRVASNATKFLEEDKQDWYVRVVYAVDVDGVGMYLKDNFMLGYPTDSRGYKFSVFKVASLLKSIRENNAGEAPTIQGDDDWYALVGTKIVADVTIKKDDKGKYPDQNNVQRYIHSEADDGPAVPAAMAVATQTVPTSEVTHDLNDPGRRLPF